MKISKGLLIILMLVLLTFAVGAVSATDDANITDIDELSAADQEIIEEDSLQTTDDVLSAGDDEKEPITVTIKDVVPVMGSVNNVGYDENITIEIEVNDDSFDLTQNKVELKIAGDHVSDVAIDATTKKGSYIVPSGTYDQGRYYVEATLVDTANSKVISGHNLFTVIPAEVTINVQNIEAVTGAAVNVPINITSKKNGKGVNGTAVVTIFFNTTEGIAKNISKEATIIDGTGEATMDMSKLMGMMSGMMNGNNSDWSNMFNSSGNGLGNIGNMFSGGSFLPKGPSGMPMTSTDVKFNYYFPVGNYTVTIEFLANRNYAYASNDTNLSVTYPDVMYYAEIVQAPQKPGDMTAIFVMVMDKYGVPVPGKVLSYELDGKQKGDVTLDKNGSAVLTFANVLNGNHKLFMSSKATGNVTNDTFEFAVLLPKVNINFDMKDIKVAAINTAVDGNSGKYFTVTLKDALGNLVSDAKVQVTLNGNKYAVTTDANGVAKVALNIAKANVYTCAVCFLGNDAYNAAFDMVKVTVTKQAAKLTAAKKTFKANAKTKKLAATFKTAKGKAIKGKKITFKVNGKTYSAKTNKKGVATVKVKLTKKGTYTFKASYAGDDTYKAVTKKAKLVLK